jgi:threonyl-tRNA synthetase
MNDAHIYCSKEQIPSECANVLAMHRRVYEVLGLTAWRVRLSTRGRGQATASKYVDDAAASDESEAMLRRALVESGLPFEEVEGEAAFYGPKIDFQFRSVGGREETASTLQLDFAVPARLGLSYVGADGAEHRPYVLHRAPLGTHERFVALLLEHFDGAFPTWLAPVQVRVIPVSEGQQAYAAHVVARLRAQMVRAEVDQGREGERLSKRVRAAAVRKIPNVLVVGEREQATASVTLRVHGSEQGRPHRVLPLTEMLARIAQAIASRELGPV